MKLLVLFLAFVAGQGLLGKNIVQLAQSVPDLSTLVTALTAGGLTTTLSGNGPFTVFAPTNEAFGKLPAATLAHLLDPANIKDLDAVLEYPVLSGAVFSKDLKTFQMVKTVEGDELKIVKTGSRVLVNTATVTSADNAATNGVVHIIDGVLIPPAGPSPGPSPGPGPSPAVNHLWFRGYTGGGFNFWNCGEVDAAARMPAALFDPSNAAALKAYTEITLELYGIYAFDIKEGSSPIMKLGRCADYNFTKFIASEKSEWAPVEMMGGICEKQCKCNFCPKGEKEPGLNCSRVEPTPLPTCKDAPDDPKLGTWCSLCGPKFNKPILIDVYECKNGPLSDCPGPKPKKKNTTSALLKELLERVQKQLHQV
jgi:hypothetical protein